MNKWDGSGGWSGGTGMPKCRVGRDIKYIFTCGVELLEFIHSKINNVLISVVLYVSNQRNIFNNKVSSRCSRSICRAVQVKVRVCTQRALFIIIFDMWPCRRVDAVVGRKLRWSFM